MAHVSSEELDRRLKEAEEKVECGAKYAHFKHPEVAYTVKGFGILEATEEAAVLYEAPKGATFIRPLASWLEEVEWEGQKVPRFAKNTQNG